MSKRIDIRNAGPRKYIKVDRNGIDTGILVTFVEDDESMRLYIPDCVYEDVREAMDYEYSKRPTKGSK